MFVLYTIVISETKRIPLKLGCKTIMNILLNKKTLK